MEIILSSTGAAWSRQLTVAGFMLKFCTGGFLCWPAYRGRQHNLCWTENNLLFAWNTILNENRMKGLERMTYILLGWELIDCLTAIHWSIVVKFAELLSSTSWFHRQHSAQGPKTLLIFITDTFFYLFDWLKPHSRTFTCATTLGTDWGKLALLY